MLGVGSSVADRRLAAEVQKRGPRSDVDASLLLLTGCQTTTNSLPRYLQEADASQRSSNLALAAFARPANNFCDNLAAF